MSGDNDNSTENTQTLQAIAATLSSIDATLRGLLGLLQEREAGFKERKSSRPPFRKDRGDFGDRPPRRSFRDRDGNDGGGDREERPRRTFRDRDDRDEAPRAPRGKGGPRKSFDRKDGGKKFGGKPKKISVGYKY